MQLSNIPGKLVLPFANGGSKNSIPVTSQIGITPGAASLTDGFPPLTMTPVAAGGVPPSGLDMNGILYEMSAVIRWANAGGGYPFDATFAADTNVNGYPKGARIMRADGLGYWFNTAENNVTDPESAGAAAAGWVPDFTTGVAAVAMASANVTLTPAQYGKPVIVITGALTTNLNLIFPALAQGWYVVNGTTGGYKITAKTASGVGVDLMPGAYQINSDGSTIRSLGADLINPAIGASAIAYQAPGANSVSRNVAAVLAEIVTSADKSTWGSRCLSVGANNLPDASTGIENVILGNDNLKSNTSGYANIAIGNDVLKSNTSGGFNIGIGGLSLTSNTTGQSNVAIGTYSGYANTTGNGNTSLGGDTNRYNETGSNNAAGGTQALYNNVNGSLNTAFGTYAARGVNNPPDTGPGTGPSPTFLTAFGAQALYAASGTLNTAIGFDAGYLTTGSYNTYAGAEAGSKIVSGSHNVFVGYNSGQNIAQVNTASYCVALGRESYTTGDNAVAIGSAVSAGTNQIAIGNSAHVSLAHYGHLVPQTDATQNIGSAIGRYNNSYFAVAPTIGSDERIKQQVQDIDEAVLRAWSKVEFKQYKLNSAVEQKGDKARWHFGVLAQKIKEAFESEGLDAAAYGLLCYDEWDDQWVDIPGVYEESILLDSSGKPMPPKLVSPPRRELKISAGNSYSVRYEEALVLECAYLRSKI